MKYLIFSDTHLDKDFDNKKLEFLIKIIEQADRVIIAGDFWEGLQITFDDFVKSEWNKLFPYLKKKNTVYVHGNHDSKKWTDKRVSLFSVEQTEQYIFKSGNKTFYVEHGDRAKILGVVITRTVSESISLITKKNPQISHRLEKFAFNTFGRNFHQSLSKRMNDKIKNQLSKEFTGDRILICGHSHHQELDLKHHYIGSGMIDFGLAQYVLIENGQIFLKEDWYK